MYFIHGGRASGKTCLLIQHSYITKVPIMAATYQKAVLLKEQAKRMGLEIPEPIVWTSVGEGIGHDLRNVLIDDGEYFINHVLARTAKAKCVAMTIYEPILELPIQFDSPTAKMVHIDRINNEIYTYGNWDYKQEEKC